MQCVLLHGSYSSEDPVKFGVQGCVVGPIRFSLFIDDLPLRVQTGRGQLARGQWVKWAKS